MALNGKRLGDLLLEADVLTKRQLQKALALQTSGDTRQLGEILIELGFITLEDLTEIMLSNGSKAPIQTSSVKPKELSEEAVLNTKFTLSVQTMIAAGTGLASLVGMWYALQSDIQEAKELPNLSSLYENEYPSRPEGHNWPRSKEQYNQQVGDLQDEMDDAHETIEEMKEAIKELQKDIKDLERRKKDKK